MLNDVEVMSLLAQIGMDFRSPLTQLEQTVIAGTGEDRRVWWTLPVIPREPHAYKANVQPCGARFCNRITSLFNNAALAGLFTKGRLAVGAICMDQIIFHIQYQIDSVLFSH